MFAANSDGRARLALATALTIFPTAGTLAHGFAGSRFFPATITIDDPFVADELSLPTVSNQKTGTDPSVVETDISGELSKRITSDFGFSIGYAWSHLDQAGPPHNPNGFHNLEITPRYQFLLNAPHEAVASVGVITEVGGTGAKRVGAVPFATYTPTLYFGKARLSICVRSVHKLIRRGVLPATQLMHSAPWQIPVAALETEAVKIGICQVIHRRPKFYRALR